MADRELLELAAKAAGYWSNEYGCVDKLPSLAWDPLNRDADALRLAVKLGMNIDITPGKFVEASLFVDDNTRRVSGVAECGPAPDYYAATRLAIVRAAAEIGRATPPIGD